MTFDRGVSGFVSAAWMTFLAYWAVMAFSVKRTARRQNLRGRFFHVLIGAIASFLLVGSSRRWGGLAIRFVPRAAGFAIAGALLAWIGIGLAIWARTILGRNWSATPTVKVDHALIRSGPYSVVRHPIYSGLLVAGLGTALAIGEARCLLAVAIMFIGWLWKSRTEEQLMIEQFGHEYEDYRRHTWALVPFVV